MLNMIHDNENIQKVKCRSTVKRIKQLVKKDLKKCSYVKKQFLLHFKIHTI